MNKNFQKNGVRIVLFVYFATILLQTIQYFFNQKSEVLAEQISKTTDVVAVFVDNNIYNSQQENIRWYATDYIQKKLPGTVALVMPVDKNIQAYEIQRGLDNLYFEGMKDQPSSLKGVILIGELPLPVVNYNNGYFPTVYPYTDFVNKKYVYNPDTKFFEFTKIADAHPEIWHSLINFGSGSQEYSNFFQKLKTYDSNPENFVAKKIYYDDFIDAKQKFNALALKQYINKMLFSDDIANHRYSTMLLNFLGYDANGNSIEEVGTLQQDVKDLGLSGQISKLNFASGQDAVQTKESNHVPTKLINESVDEILKSFKDVVGDTYLVNKRDNIAAGGRYLQSEVDGFDSNIDKLDETSRGIIDKMNAVYEEKIDEYAKLYQTNIIVPASYKDEAGNVYLENYLFGTNAKDIKQAKDLSFYRGTYNPAYDILSLQNQPVNNMDKNFGSLGFSNSQNYINPMTKSAGLSLGLFNTLVAYNRLYNFDEESMYDDFEEFSGSKCNEKGVGEMGMYYWGLRNYGLNTPLLYDYKSDGVSGGTYYQNAIKPLLNQAGSKKLPAQEASKVEAELGTTYKAGNLYQNMIGTGYGDPCHKNEIHESWQNAATSKLSAFERAVLENQKGLKKFGGTDDMPFYGTSYNAFIYTYGQPDKDFGKWEWGIENKIYPKNIGFYFSGNEQPILSADESKKFQLTGASYEDLESYVSGDIKFYTGLIVEWKPSISVDMLRKWKRENSLYQNLAAQNIKILQNDSSTGVVVGYTGAILKGKFVDDFTGVAISLSGTSETKPLDGKTLTTKGFLALNTGYVVENSGYIFVSTGYIFGKGLGSKSNPSQLPTKGNSKINDKYGTYYESVNILGASIGSFYRGPNGGFQGTTGDGVDVVYKTIPSIVKHINPIESDINRMNIVTPDRAIDTKRISFQGQNGSLVEWYYPNFYDVPVYKQVGNDYVLKTQAELEIAVRDYIASKTEALNKQIQNDFDKPGTGLFLTYDNAIRYKVLDGYKLSQMFSGQDQYFGLQLQYNKKDMMKFTPADKKLLLNMNPELYIGTGINQRIKTISQNEMLQILSGSLGALSQEDVIKSIAKALYQQNGGWETKVTKTDSIGQYFSGLKQTFAPSEKVKYSVDQSIKLSTSSLSGNKFIFPTQNISGYEIAFINSDGKDLLGDSTEAQESNLIKDLSIVRNGVDFATKWEEDIKSINWSKISLSDVLKLNNIKDKQSSILSPVANNSYTPTGRIIDESCSIPPSGSVPLKNWIPAFNCWLKETTKAPFKATLSYSCSQGPVLKPGDLPKAENIDLDLDNNINVEIISGTSFTNEQFGKPLNVKFSFSNFSTQKANITFRAKGSYEKNCLTLNGNSLCNRGSFEDLEKSGVVDIQGVDMTKPFFTNLSFQNQSPDDITLIAKIQTTNSSGEKISTEKELQINMIAGSVGSVIINLPSNSLIKGGQTPFSIQAFDSGGNQINQGIENLKIKVDSNLATINGPSESSSEIITSQFGDAYVLDASKTKNISDGTKIKILVSKVGPEGKEIFVAGGEKEINFVNGVVEISSLKNLNGSQGNISFKLEDKKYYDKDSSGVVQFNTSTGASFDLAVKGGNQSIPAFVSIRSAKGLIKIGESNVVSGYVNGNWINQTIFSEKEIFETKNSEGSKKRIYLIPTMKAGDDQLLIDVAGLPTSIVNVKILPGDAKKTILTQITSELEVGQKAKFGMIVSDQWNNPTNQNVNVLVSATENISFSPTNKLSNRTTFLNLPSSATGFDIYPINGGKGYVSAILTGAGAPTPGYTPTQIINGQTITGEYTLNQVPAFLMVKIGANNWYSANAASNQSSDERIPKEGLNAMYVNLFGSDWGNIFGYYTSTDKDMIKNLFKNSPKTLAITTQLVKPENLTKVNLSIDKNLHVINNAGYDLRLRKSGKTLYLVVGQFPSLGELKLGDFDISQTGAGISYITGAVDNTIASNQIKNNKIFITKNNIEYQVLDLENMTLAPEADIEFVQAQNLTFNVLFDKKVIGKIIIKNNSDYKIDENNLPSLEQNKTTLGYSAGSTNSDKNYLFLSQDDISYLKSYKSIEDSPAVQEGIGFRNDFKNITNFAGGANVGDSTRFFASEFVVNYGDPLIGKISNNPNLNKTNFYVWTGQRNGTGGFVSPTNPNIKPTTGMYFGAKTGDVVILKNYIGDLQLITGGTNITLINSGYKVELKEFSTGVNFNGSGVSFVPLSGTFNWYKLTTGSVSSKLLTGKTTLEMSGKQLINFANFTRDKNKNIGLTFSGNVTGGFVMNMFYKKQKLGDIFIINNLFDYKQTNNLNPENEVSSPATGLDFDMSIGKQIYGGSKQISNAFPIDFNDDGQKDVAVAFSDGSIKLMKNYQGSFEDIGELMFINDGIKEIFAGKTTSGGQQDIFVRSAEDRIRVYQNTGGAFSVDGNPLCIDVPGFSGAADQMKVDIVSQFITNDINNDGLLDIITNDKAGDISVFWGGASTSGHNYISSNTGDCDENWKSRSTNNKTIVHSFGLSLKQGSVMSDSLLRWNGLKNNGLETTSQNITDENYNNQGNSQINKKMEEAQKAAEARIEAEAKACGGGGGIIGAFTSFACGLLKLTGIFGFFLAGLMKDKAKAQLYKTKYVPYLKEEQKKRNIDIMDPTASSGALTQSQVLGDVRRYVDIPSQYKAKPFDEGLMGEFVSYVKGNYLTGSDPVSLSRTFSGENSSGSLVQGDIVTVKINLTGGPATIIEKLDGPFDVLMSGDKMYGMSGDFEQEIKAKYPSAIFDSGNVPPGYLFKLDNFAGEVSYKVKYQGVTPVKFKLKTDLTGSVENNDLRELKTIRVVSLDECLKKIWDFEKNKTFSGFDNKFLEFEQQLSGKIESINSNVQDHKNKIASGGTSLLNAAGDSEDWTRSLKSNGKTDPNSVMDRFAKRINQDYTKIQRGLCNGFKFGNSDCEGGLPVPFNVSFLDPGMFNVMGYPLFFSPGIPVAWDYWMGPPQASQIFRLYVSPTLTMGMGVSLCLGPYAAGIALPQPFASIGGNCIVAGINNPFMCKAPDKPTPSESVIDWQHDLQDIGVCEKTAEEREEGKNISPLQMSDGATQSSGSNGTSGGTKITVDLGIVAGKTTNVPMKDVFVAKLEKVELQPGNPIILKVQSGMTQGLVESIIKKWLDKQIQYVVNNLTSMSIYMYLPDFNGLTKGFDKVSPGIQNTVETIKNTKLSLNASTGAGLADRLPSKQAIASISDSINNPFEQLGALFNETNLLKVRYDDINLNVPFVYQEDLKKYQSYLNEYIDTTSSRIESWKNVLNNIKIDASIKGNASANFELQSNLLNEYEKLLGQLKQNRDRLQEYAEFPFKLYDYVHVVDRYVYEISCIVKKFLEGTTGWLADNSMRFEKWVNAAMLAIVALDSWQILIDFTVQWKTKCGKCTVDNYDYHSFMLSLLNFEVPIIKIPNFRLPDIYLDFSKFDIGSTITLPRIKFIPQSVPLPKLPLIPAAPSISVFAKLEGQAKIDAIASLNVNLPDIPILPPVPKLPEIPSVIPTLELKLPTLPPAPEIPKLSVKVSGYIKVAGQIATIFLCIIKGKIGLVGESDVKTKVEQITQRTRRLRPFDFLKLRVADPPVEGKDIKIESFVRLRADTDILYDFLNKQAKKINGFSSKAVNSYTNVINSASQKAQSSVDKVFDPITKATIPEIFGTKNNISTLSDNEYKLAIQDQINQISKDMMGLESQWPSDDIANKVQKLQVKSQASRLVQANYKGMEKVSSDIEKFFAQKIEENDKLLRKIQTDYNGFLENISQPILVAGEENEKNFSLKLFSADPIVQNSIQNEKNPVQTYFDLAGKQVSQINETLANSKNVALDDRQLQQASSFFWDLGAKIERLTPADETKPLAGSTPSPTPASSSYKDDLADPTQGVVGVYLENLSGDIVPGFGWSQKSKDIQEKNSYVKVDMNNDGSGDILYWDARSVGIKYAGQSTGNYQDIKNNDGTTTKIKIEKPAYKGYYVLKDFNKVVERRTLNGQNFDITLKTYSKSDVVNRFRRGNQNFETINYLWDSNNPQVDGYLLKVQYRVDVGKDKLEKNEISNYPNNNKEFFVFIVDRNQNVLDKNIILNTKVLGKQTIDLNNTGDIRIIPTNMKNGGMSSIIEKSLNQELGRNWAYVSATPVGLESNSFVQLGPWSAQALGGVSKRNDDQAPTLSLGVVRDTKNQYNSLSEGGEFDGFINTTYSLSGFWSDNNMVIKNSLIILSDTGVVYSGTHAGGNIPAQKIYSLKPGNYNLNLSAVDTNDNISSFSTNIKISSPKIDIKIEKTANGVFTPIVILSNDIDDGNINFERCDEIGTKCEVLMCNGGGLQVSPGQYEYRGCSFGNTISAYTDNNKTQKYAIIDKISGQITAQNNYQIGLDFDDNIKLKDENNNQIDSSYNLVQTKVYSGENVFGKILLSIKNIEKITPGILKQNNLNDSNISTCFAPSENNTNLAECEVVIGKNGVLAVQTALKTQYTGEYKFENGSIIYTLKKNNQIALEIKFKPNPL